MSEPPREVRVAPAGERVLADEQAALRRVATLVARGALPEDVFATVAEEVGRVLPVDMTSICRYEPDRTITFVASWGRAREFFPVGTRLPLGGANLGTIVSETGRSARIDRYSEHTTGALGDRVRAAGVNSSLATPIRVEGRLWGVIAASSKLNWPLPPDAEARLASFTELVATAIANTAARMELRRLADEQGALRRVATLVVRGLPAAEVFAAVVEELERLFDAQATTIARLEPDGTLTIVGSGGSATEHMPVGTRVELQRGMVLAEVARTGRAARVDDDGDADGDLAEVTQRTGVRCSVAVPIMVEGALWGSMGAGTSGMPFPADTEQRMAEFTELVGSAIASIQARVDLAASRARIVAAADAERRRVVRDLHDGAQQRLVHTIITLTGAQRAMANGQDDAAALLAEALDHAQRATTEVRDLAHGILPAILTHRGLDAGIGALTSRMSVPVTIDVAVGRLPAQVEATAYFFVAEALTNVVKHANARQAQVTAHVEDGTLHVEVRDDGVGGARSDGSGLLGLADRLAVLDGRLRVETPADGGTLLVAAIPLAAS
jgi:signal transduction histidine kinase